MGFEIPEEILEALDLHENESLEWVIREDGSVEFRKTGIINPIS